MAKISSFLPSLKLFLQLLPEAVGAKAVEPASASNVVILKLLLDWILLRERQARFAAKELC